MQCVLEKVDAFFFHLDESIYFLNIIFRVHFHVAKLPRAFVREKVSCTYDIIA